MVFPNFSATQTTNEAVALLIKLIYSLGLYHKLFEDWPYLLITIIFSAIEAILLFLGIFSPFARIQEFWIFKEEFSIHSLIIALFDQQNFLLGGTILVFGVLIPLMRLFTNFVLINRLKNLKDRTFFISGKLFIDEPIIVPKNYNLKIESGAELIFKL